jgi:HEAT repeat protein
VRPFVRAWLSLSLVSAVAAAADAPAPSPELIKRANALLDAALDASAPDLKSDALAALGASHRPDAREKLVAAVGDDDGHIRFGGAQGLRFLADANTGPAIAAAWRKEKGWSIKKELSAAAAATGARELLPDLKAALLYETQLDHRESLAWALEDLGDPDAQASLAQMGNPPKKKLIKDGADSWSRHVLQGKKEGDIRLAVKTLAFMGVRDDVPLLQKQLDSKDSETRLWAAAALVRLAQPLP